MITPDEFTKAVNKGVAEVRSMLHEAAGRFEAEAKKMAEAAGVDEQVNSERIKTAGDQLQNVVEMMRAEAVNAAGQFSEGINGVVDDLRDFVQGNTAGAADAANAGAADTVKTPPPPAPADAKKPAPKKTAAKKTPAAKTAAKKATAKKSGAKKAGSKKAAAGKSTAKKSAAKKSAKKSTAKKSAAKKPSKKSAKKSTAKKSSTKK